MIYPVVLHVDAEKDIFRAASHIAEKAGESFAVDWLVGLAEKVESLKQMPNRCPFALEQELVSERTMRQILYSSYRIIFFVHPEYVEVIHVRHMAQDKLEDL